jgi:polyisoprenoid-binding protein YceI
MHCDGLSAKLIDGAGVLRARLAFALMLVALPVKAESPIYRVEPALTTAEFVATQLGVFFARGHFVRMSGRIVYDPLNSAGTVDFDLDAKSVATGWSSRDAFIRGEEMFDAERHTVIQFRSTRLTFAHDKPAQIDGELTLRGVKRPLSLTIARFDCGKVREDGRETCSAEASGTIHRSEFGMDILVPLISDNVELRFVVTAIRE